MRICRLIFYDIKQGFYQNRGKCLGIILIVFVSCLDFYLRKISIFTREETAISHGTLMDYLCFLLGGMKEYKPGINAIFVFPAKWFLLHLFLLYCTLYYPYRDLLSSVGGNLLVRSKKRWAWWLSKCIWNMMFILFAYVLIYATTALFCFGVKETFTTQVTTDLLLTLMDMETNIKEFPPGFSLFIIISPIAVSIAMSLLQMTMSLFMKPVFSLGFSAIILLTSAYFMSPWLVGNYAMPIRSTYILAGGVGFAKGLILCGILILLSFVMGIIAFCRYDILQVSEL